MTAGLRLLLDDLAAVEQSGGPSGGPAAAGSAPPPPPPPPPPLADLLARAGLRPSADGVEHPTVGWLAEDGVETTPQLVGLLARGGAAALRAAGFPQDWAAAVAGEVKGLSAAGP